MGWGGGGRPRGLNEESGGSSNYFQLQIDLKSAWLPKDPKWMNKPSVCNNSLSFPEPQPTAVLSESGHLTIALISNVVHLENWLGKGRQRELIGFLKLIN